MPLPWALASRSFAGLIGLWFQTAGNHDHNAAEVRFIDEACDSLDVAIVACIRLTCVGIPRQEPTG